MAVTDPTSGQIIEVSSSSELAAAYDILSNTTGGGHIVIASDADGFAIDLRDGGGEPVHITSADPDDPATISRIATNGVENLRVSDLNVSSIDTARPDWHTDVAITASRNIELENLDFSSTATRLYDPAEEGAHLAETLGTIRSSQDVSFSSNSVSGYYQGLSIFESTDLVVDGNDFTELQGDGIRMGGVQNIDITNNYMHDFFGTVQTFNHNDMIQLWSTNADLVSSGITISGNILDAGDGASYQTIFFNNEALLREGQVDHIYSDITISNNLIHSGNIHGITINGADGVDVFNNTVLWNTDAGMIARAGEEGVSSMPGIQLNRVTDATVTDNISGRIDVSDAVQTGNHIIDYDTPTSDNYIGLHFVGATEGGDADLTDLRLRPDSEWQGSGADDTDPLTVSESGVVPVVTVAESSVDLEVLVFNAGFSVDETGFVDPDSHTFRWHFGDGTVREGVEVVHRFDTPGSHDVRLEILNGANEVIAESDRNVDVESNTFFSLDFENGLQDGSSYDSILDVQGDMVASDDGTGFMIGRSDQVGAARWNDHYHNLESFGISLDMKIIDDDVGRFIHLHNVMYGQINSDGQVSFRLDTNEGIFRVDSGDVTIHDGEFHKISVGYSDQAGTLVLMIDGVIVGSTEASGTTGSQGSHSFLVGSDYTDAPDAVVDNIYFGLNPSAAGVEIDGAGIDPAVFEATLVDPADPPSTKGDYLNTTDQPLVLPDFEDFLGRSVAAQAVAVEKDPVSQASDDAVSGGVVTEAAQSTLEQTMSVAPAPATPMPQAANGAADTPQIHMEEADTFAGMGMGMGSASVAHPPLATLFVNSDPARDAEAFDRIFSAGTQDGHNMGGGAPSFDINAVFLPPDQEDAFRQSYDDIEVRMAEADYLAGFSG